MDAVEARFWSELLWAVLGLGLVIYAVTGGADFGAGVWHIFARGPRKEAQRLALREAIAPIWEANHVWMIFAIVVLFSAFPRAFAALCISLHVPIALALIGIVMRGSAYAFRAYGIQPDRARREWDRVFAGASFTTPLFLGAVVGGVSSGEIRIVDGQVVTGFFAGWTGPFAACVGLFSLALFAMLAAVYLSADTQGALSDDFRRRALLMEVIAGAFAALTFAMAAWRAPALFHNLSASRWAGPVQLVTACLAVATIALLLERKPSLARYTAAGQVAMVVVGWGLAMRGHFILPDMTLERASAHPEIMPALALALGLGALLLGPALAYLYWVFKRPSP
ncbi:MAG TPA: cytochrome d ubiquinol oxidase subunit II [Polyangiaceae bacterium]